VHLAVADVDKRWDFAPQILQSVKRWIGLLQTAGMSYWALYSRLNSP